MGDASSIEWTDATWNPVRGCSRVSKGCEHCYAEGVARRFAGPGQPYEGLVRLDGSGKPKAQWNGTVRMVPEHLADPLRWKRPRRVFVNSMSDLFHEALAFEDIAAIFGVMAAAPQHTFQILTKRPERARDLFAWALANGPPGVAFANAASSRVPERFFPFDRPMPFANVWIGVSVEDQATADERIPMLLDVPAAVRFVSYEPALGPVDFKRIGDGGELGATYDVLRGGMTGCAPRDAGGPKLDWVIVGGESGHGARPFAIEWALRTISACRQAHVPCFVKQVGALTVTEGRPGLEPGTWGWRFPAWKDGKGGDPAEWEAAGEGDLCVREYPEARS